MSAPPPDNHDDADRSAAPDDAPSADALTCKECGARLEPDQTYCLECGTPTDRAPRLRKRSRGAMLVAAALIAFGVGAGALAYAVANRDESARPAASNGGRSGAGTADTADSHALTIPTDAATSDLPPDTSMWPGDPTTDGFDTGGFDTGGFPSDPTVTDPLDTGGTDAFPPVPPSTDFATETEQPTAPGATTFAPAPTTFAPVDPVAPPTTPGTASDSDWPIGKIAWTVVLSSVRNETAARTAATAANNGGLDAGVLFSSDYPGLRPGFWVVFSGNYPTQSAAAREARSLAARYPGAYPRRIAG